MYAEIIATGTELLMGETQDTNSSYLAAQLPMVGLEVRQVTLVADNLDQFNQVLELAWHRSPFTFTIGGLGPTQDDITREGIAHVFKEGLFIDDHLLKELKNIFRRRSIPMPPHNLKQAGLIPSAVGIPNRTGTAPGWWADKEGHVVVALPGPPHELYEMWEREVVPRIRQRVTGEVILTRTLKTIGLSEALVDEMANPFLGNDNPYLGIYAKPDGIYLRLIARGTTREEAVQLLVPVEERLRYIFSDNIWGVDLDSPQEAVGAILRKHGLSLATMESCTGGLLASVITDIPGSSDYFKGGIVSYTDAIKSSSGVDQALIQEHGAVSAEVAEAMAEAVRTRMDADFGIGITGVVGPENLKGKPAGTVYIGVATNGRRESSSFRFPAGNRSVVKHRAVVSALLALRRML